MKTLRLLITVLLCVLGTAQAQGPVTPQELLAPQDTPVEGDCPTFHGNIFEWRPTCGGPGGSGECHTHPCVNKLCFVPRDCPEPGFYQIGIGANGDAICRAFPTPTATATATPTATLTPTPTVTLTPTPTESVTPTATPGFCAFVDGCPTLTPGPSPTMTPEGAVVTVENGGPNGAEADFTYDQATNHLVIGADGNGECTVGDLTGTSVDFYVQPGDVEVTTVSEGNNNIWAFYSFNSGTNETDGFRMIRSHGQGTVLAPLVSLPDQTTSRLEDYGIDTDNVSQTGHYDRVYIAASPSPSYVPMNREFEIGGSSDTVKAVMRFLGLTHDVQLPQITPSCYQLGLGANQQIVCKATPTASATTTLTPTLTPTPTATASPQGQAYIRNNTAGVCASGNYFGLAAGSGLQKSVGTDCNTDPDTFLCITAGVSDAGCVSTTTQSFAGNKTFTGNVTVQGDLTIKPTACRLGASSGGVVECVTASPTPTASPTATSTTNIGTSTPSATVTITPPTPTATPLAIIPIVSGHVTIPAQSLGTTYYFWNDSPANTDPQLVNGVVSLGASATAGASNLWCVSKTGPGPGNRVTFIFNVNNGLTPIRCQLSGSQTSCSSRAITTVSDGDTIVFRMTPSLATNEFDVTCGITLYTSLPTPTPTITFTPVTCPTNPDGSGPAQQGENANREPNCAPTWTATPTPTPTVTLTPTPTLSPTATTLATPSRTATPTPTPTPSPTNTRTATAATPGTPTPTVSPTPNTVVPILWGSTNVPSDGTTYYFSVIPGPNATELNVSTALPVAGFKDLSGSGLGAIKYIAANLSCTVSPAPGTGNAWDFCLRKAGGSACSSLGIWIANGNVQAIDNGFTDTFGQVSTVAIQMRPVGNPTPADKVTCGFEIRYAPAFSP